MNIKLIWEHNGNDSIVYAESYIGAYARGESLQVAVAKLEKEITSYCKWCGKPFPDSFDFDVVQDKASDLNIKDADSDVIFDIEKTALSLDEYTHLKELALKSARNFILLYSSIPHKNKTDILSRSTFYGKVPTTAFEMYEHTKNVNEYYFAEIGIDADNSGDIFECRKRGFELLEQQNNFLDNKVILGSYGEEWSVRKVLRRFIWHDRIHAKAMYRMAKRVFPESNIANTFDFIL